MNTRAETLPDLKSRIGVILENPFTIAFYSFVCSYHLVRTRIYDPAESPTYAWKYLVQKYSLILRYTTEQWILWFVIQLVLISYLNAELSFIYIPALNCLYILGRFSLILDNLQKWKKKGLSSCLSLLQCARSCSFVNDFNHVQFIFWHVTLN